MRQLRLMFFNRLFSEIDQPMGKLRDIRDSYRAMNVEIYGEQMAALLNDWQ